MYVNLYRVIRKICEICEISQLQRISHLEILDAESDRRMRRECGHWNSCAQKIPAESLFNEVCNEIDYQLVNCSQF